MKGFTILIVDDNRQNLDVLEQILKLKEFAVRMSRSGTHALKSINALLPDLVLLDVNMPGMNGYEVCEQLKHSEKTRHVPVLFLTADYTEQVRAEGKQAGGDGFLEKPFKAGDIYAAIERFCKP